LVHLRVGPVTGAERDEAALPRQLEAACDRSTWVTAFAGQCCDVLDTAPSSTSPRPRPSSTSCATGTVGCRPRRPSWDGSRDASSAFVRPRRRISPLASGEPGNYVTFATQAGRAPNHGLLRSAVPSVPATARLVALRYGPVPPAPRASVPWWHASSAA